MGFYGNQRIFRNLKGFCGILKDLKVFLGSFRDFKWDLVKRISLEQCMAKMTSLGLEMVNGDEDLP